MDGQTDWQTDGWMDEVKAVLVIFHKIKALCINVITKALLFFMSKIFFCFYFSRGYY